MKILKSQNVNKVFDLAILGLGYEARSTFLFNKLSLHKGQCLVLGYTYHTDKFDYQKNKNFFLDFGCSVCETEDEDLPGVLECHLKYLPVDKPVNVFIDITVMSRHRLAAVIWNMLGALSEDSCITIAYSVSEFVPPPATMPPVKEIGPIIKDLDGVPGSIGLPSSLIVSLGYEENKALGAANYIDASDVVVFVPESKVSQFNDAVLLSNKNFLISVSEKSIFNYDLHSPYRTYIDLKSVVLSLMKGSRPIVLPLGPKLMAALSVILGFELYPELPVWRLSSRESEIPVNRLPSDHVIKFTLKL